MTRRSDTPDLVPLLGDPKCYAVAPQLLTSIRLRASDGALGIALRDDAPLPCEDRQRLYIDSHVPNDSKLSITLEEVKLGGFYYLSDVGEGCGGICTLPGSHQRVEVVVGWHPGCRHQYNEWNEILYGARVELRDQAGDFVLLHPVMLHARLHGGHAMSRVALCTRGVRTDQPCEGSRHVGRTKVPHLLVRLCSAGSSRSGQVVNRGCMMHLKYRPLQAHGCDQPLCGSTAGNEVAHILDWRRSRAEIAYGDLGSSYWHAPSRRYEAHSLRATSGWWREALVRAREPGVLRPGDRYQDDTDGLRPEAADGRRTRNDHDDPFSLYDVRRAVRGACPWGPSKRPSLGPVAVGGHSGPGDFDAFTHADVRRAVEPAGKSRKSLGSLGGAPGAVRVPSHGEIGG